MIDLVQLSFFPLKQGEPTTRPLTVKGNQLKITLFGKGDFVEHAYIENLSTNEVLYDWHNVKKQSVQMALDEIISNLKVV